MTTFTTHIPTLTTERLTLRAPQANDVDAYAAFYASDRSRIIGGPLDRTAAWKVLTNDVGHWMLRGYGWWTIEDTEGCVGSVGFHFPEGHEDVELGWSLFSGTGKGYATEAASAALTWAEGRFERIISYIARGNVASQKVAERLGAEDTGVEAAAYPHCTIWRHTAGGLA